MRLAAAARDRFARARGGVVKLFLLADARGEGRIADDAAGERRYVHAAHPSGGGSESHPLLQAELHPLLRSDDAEGDAEEDSNDSQLGVDIDSVSVSDEEIS